MDLRNSLLKGIQISSLLLLLACNRNIVFSDYQRISEDKGWPKDEMLTFEVDIKDTTSLHDMFINIRNADNYPYRNLFLFFHTEYPGGAKRTDTLECLLADEKGRWLGNGSGDLWDNIIPFKHNFKFPRSGKYVFKMEQAMRFGDKNAIDPLPLILDAGITIEKAVAK